MCALVLGAQVVACGVARVPNAPGCAPDTCDGCCSNTGECVLDTTAQACGRGGANCEACLGALQCVQGRCASVDLTDGPKDGCPAAAKPVYVVDANRMVSSFDPRSAGNSNSFTDLGRLGCGAKPGAEPFSMSVDRQAQAWVIYDSGELFKVNLTSPTLDCTRTGFVPQQGVARFGMGFVANAPGSSDETLFIAGSPLAGSLLISKFGTLGTTPPYAFSELATLAGAPELTGTGDARLWAFFPNLAPPRIAPLDRMTGQPLGMVMVPALAGPPTAWAFAFWGGDFWVFLQRVTDASTHVWRVTQAGVITDVVPETRRRIVGAGVSTCAPVSIN